MKTLITAAATVALLVAGAPLALAQDDDRTCDEAKTNVTELERKLKDAESAEHVQEKAAVEAAKPAVTAAQAKVDHAQEMLKTDPTWQDDLDAAKAERKAAKAILDEAQAKLDKDSQKVAGLRAQVELAIQERDEACTEPSTTPTAPPADPDVDCGEVSDAEAQRILDADRSDPNRLDEDRDGVACEDEVIVTPAPVVADSVVTPSGGVATGGGPA